MAGGRIRRSCVQKGFLHTASCFLSVIIFTVVLIFSFSWYRVQGAYAPCRLPLSQSLRRTVYTGKNRKTYKVTLRKGQRKKLKLRGCKGRIRWRSSNKKIVKVSKKGKVTAKKKGKARVYAYLKSGKRICFRITVKAKVSQKQVSATKTGQDSLGSRHQTGYREDTKEAGGKQQDGTETGAKQSDFGTSAGRTESEQTEGCSHVYQPVYEQKELLVTDEPARDEVTWPDACYAEECSCGMQFFVCFLRDKDKVDFQALDLAAKEAHALHCKKECAPFEEELASLSEKGISHSDGTWQAVYRQWQETYDLHSSYHGIEVMGDPLIIRQEAKTHTENETHLTGYRCSKCGVWRPQ